MKFRKKDKEIDAEQFLSKPVRGLCLDTACPDVAHVHTIHDNQLCTVQHGDWIVPEPDGEHFYPVKNEIFESTYERV
jgi:hypothetical protein